MKVVYSKFKFIISIGAALFLVFTSCSSDDDEEDENLGELRFFGGLSVPKAAAVLGVSQKTVQNEWRFARAWLRRRIYGP